MKYGYHNYHWLVEVKIHSLYSGLFDAFDRQRIDEPGNYEMPPDFLLHLAYYLLEQENMPGEILEPLRTWIRENKTLVAFRNW